MIRKEVRARTSQDMLKDYPIDRQVPDWYFRIREISNNAWTAEGCDRWGRKVARSGGNPDELLESCVRDTKVIVARSA